MVFDLRHPGPQLLDGLGYGGVEFGAVAGQRRADEEPPRLERVREVFEDRRFRRLANLVYRLLRSSQITSASNPAPAATGATRLRTAP